MPQKPECNSIFLKKKDSRDPQEHEYTTLTEHSQADDLSALQLEISLQIQEQSAAIAWSEQTATIPFKIFNN